MPETTLHSVDQKRADTVVAEQAMSEFRALRQLGWIQVIDYLMVTFIVLTWLTLLAWHVFGAPTPWNIMSCFLVFVTLVQLWTILLIFRCSHFVLLIQAYLNTLPEESARIVMAAYAGQVVKPQQTKPR